MSATNDGPDREEVIEMMMSQNGMSRSEAEAHYDQTQETMGRFLPQKLKVATTPEIVELNQIAVEREYNRAITDEAIAKLDPDGTHFCSVSLIHDFKGGEPCEPHVRGQWLLKMSDREATDEPVRAFIDMDAARYMALSEYDQETDQVVPPRQ